MKRLRDTIVLTAVCALLCSAVMAENPTVWLQKWNAEKDRDIKLTSKDVLFKTADSPELLGLVTAGFRQTDGSYVVGRLIWQGQSWSTLAGFGKVLSSKNFSTLSDEERSALFLTLLQQSYGLLGTRPYLGPGSLPNRPGPLVSSRGVDDSHRFQVWFYDTPIQSEEGEWREVLYSVSPDGSSVRARTLGSYHPLSEKLKDFPDGSGEFFE